MQLPARSVIAGGISSVLVWAIGLALVHFGIILPPGTVSGAVALVGTIVTHLTPDTLKDQAAALNVKVKDLAEWIPTIQSGPDDYPDSESKLRR